MFNQEEIKSVAEKTHTSRIVFNKLSERRRYRRTTNLDKFHNTLINEGEKIVENEYLETFKALQDLGIGALIHGRGSNPTRFKWNYNLKDVAKSALGNTQISFSNLEPMKKPLKVAKKRSQVIKAEQKASTISITLQISSDSRQEDIAALLDLARTLK